MSRASNILLPIVLCVAATNVAADTVTPSNGDRLTGTIVNLTDDTLVLKTAYAGGPRPPAAQPMPPAADNARSP